MAEVLLFHHSQGLTEGCLSFADDLRAAGHAVHVPDLYEGRTFESLSDGVGHAEDVLMHSCVPPSEFGTRGPTDSRSRST